MEDFRASLIAADEKEAKSSEADIEIDAVGNEADGCTQAKKAEEVEAFAGPLMSSVSAIAMSPLVMTPQLRKSVSASELGNEFSPRSEVPQLSCDGGMADPEIGPDDSVSVVGRPSPGGGALGPKRRHGRIVSPGVVRDEWQSSQWVRKCNGDQQMLYNNLGLMKHHAYQSLTSGNLPSEEARNLKVHMGYFEACGYLHKNFMGSLALPEMHAKLSVILAGRQGEPLPETIEKDILIHTINLTSNHMVMDSVMAAYDMTKPWSHPTEVSRYDPKNPRNCQLRVAWEEKLALFEESFIVRVLGRMLCDGSDALVELVRPAYEEISKDIDHILACDTLGDEVVDAAMTFRAAFRVVNIALDIYDGKFADLDDSDLGLVSDLQAVSAGLALAVKRVANEPQFYSIRLRAIAENAALLHQALPLQATLLDALHNMPGDSTRDDRIGYVAGVCRTKSRLAALTVFLGQSLL